MTTRELVQLILNNCERYGNGMHISYRLDSVLEEIIKVVAPDLYEKWEEKHPLSRKDEGGEEGNLPF